MTNLPPCLSDNETNVDLLNNQAIAESVVQLLQQHPDHPVTIGVHGDWGAGKSSVLEMIEASLDGQDDVLCLKFSGWRFQGFEDAKIALIEGVVTGLLEKRPALVKAGSVVKDVLRRIDWLKVARKSGGLAFTALTGIPTLDQLQVALGTLEAVTADPAKFATKENMEAAIGGVKSALKPRDESRKVPEEIGEFRKAFDALLEAAQIKQLVVLIDDLDRCLPDTAIETLEAVRLFVFTSRTAFVVAADEAMIEYAVRKHFPDLPDSTGPQTYARNYLEKLIQVPFRIPALGETETRIYVALLLIGAELGEEDEAFKRLIESARERLARPWTTGGLDASNVRDALGDKADRVSDALLLSEQVAPILASGTRGNPRQIKRFLNALVLRKRIAEARRFGGDVKIPALAKLMLAERFIPRLFDQIATVAAVAVDGICPDLADLEASVRSERGPKRREKGVKPKGVGENSEPEAVKSPEADIAEWLTTPAIRAWAAIEPALAGEDLRPYLFVAKDRKDYFGPASVLGHLFTVVEHLLGPRMAVQAYEADLKKLAPGEAAQVFEAVRVRVLSSGDLKTQPPGIDGFGVLVKAHASLESSLVSFLESLPIPGLGPWVVRGWEGVIRETAAADRFRRLLEKWAATDENSGLKAAASGVLRTRRAR